MTDAGAIVNGAAIVITVGNGDGGAEDRKYYVAHDLN